MVDVYSIPQVDFVLEKNGVTSFGLPRYVLRRSSDGVIIAKIERYRARLAIKIKGSRLIRNGKERDFWQWYYTREGKPECHTGRTSLRNLTLKSCVEDILSFLKL